MPRCLTPCSILAALALVWLLVAMESYSGADRQVGYDNEMTAVKSKELSCASRLLFFKKMDINQVSLEELSLLPGIGPVTAAAILDFRHASGFILTVDELDPLNSNLTPSRFLIVKEYMGT